MPYVKRTYRKQSSRRNRRSYRKGSRSLYRTRALSRRISAISKRVAGESQKFELTPLDFGTTIFSGSNGTATATNNRTLTTIVNGTPFVMPLNWVYEPVIPDDQTYTANTINLISNRYQDGRGFTTIANGTYQYKNPVYYKMLTGDVTPTDGTQLQYRLKYLYINAMFKSSTACRIRFVIVKDKLPTDRGATWYNSAEMNRSVFNSNNINAQLNPLSNGRFRIISDRTLSLTTIQPLKPYKFYKSMTSKIRNSTPSISEPGYDVVSNDSSTTGAVYHDFPQKLGTLTSPTPIGAGAYYLMILSDGASFYYDEDDGATDNNRFKLMSRVSYYNN